MAQHPHEEKDEEAAGAGAEETVIEADHQRDDPHQQRLDVLRVQIP